MSSPQPSGAAAPKRRLVKPVLIISLALNLLFVGLIAGTLWKFRHGKTRISKHKAFEATIEQIMTELPESNRGAAEAVLARLRSEVFPRAAGRREVVATVVKALKADPYSEENLASALADLRQLRSDVQLGLHTLSLELVRDMTVKERHRILEIFRSKRHRRRGGGRRGDSPE